jgi:hypothetical protein
MLALAARSVHELQPVDAAALVDCSALNLLGSFSALPTK